MKNFKYYEGAEILFQLSGSKGRISDHIFDLTDTSVIFEEHGEVKMSNISFIFRENWLIQILRGLSLTGGVAYFGVDSFNRLINHEGPVIQTETLLISGGMVAFSFALIPFRYRKINTSEKWQLKSIDPDAF
ncbi:MAG: hypothetical protein M0Q51_06675 [Bacteroidales bacterium]|nr:hypothetical protein [Bacteroidales bacterium]